MGQPIQAVNPALAIGRGEAEANMIGDYNHVLNDTSDSVGNYDPNTVNLNRAMDTINKNYADYVTNPVAPALNAMANQQFSPQMAGIEDIREAGGKTGTLGGGGIQSAVQGIVQGAQAGLSGGQGGGAGGPGGMGAINPIDLKKLSDQEKQQIVSNGTELKKNFNSDPDVAKSVGIINSAEQFFTLSSLYNPVKGEDGKMHIRTTDETDKMIRSAAMQTVHQAIRAGMSEDGGAAAIDLSGPVGALNSLANNLFTQKENLTADQVKSLNEAVKNVYADAVNKYSTKHDEYAAIGDKQMPPEYTNTFLGSKKANITDTNKDYDLKGLSQDLVDERVKKENEDVASEKKQADLGFGKKDTSKQEKKMPNGHTMLNGKEFDETGKLVNK